MPNDKPAVVAEKAQEAAAIAKEAAAAVDATPGIPHKGVILHILGGVVLAGGAATAIATLGLVPGLIATGGGLAAYIIGWFNPTPAAVGQFGTSAK